jgi:DNA polymerase-3 subunit gamma/tau
MTAQALYRKWRPAAFEEVIGQEHVTRTLRNALASGRIGHAYLFSGPRGTGKTSVARILAKAVNCLAEDSAERPDNTCAICQSIQQGRLLDLIEIDAASNTGVDDVRDLRDKINFAPTEARYKVYIVDEVHMLSTAAFNALLKTLEEPPPHAIFVLATTEVHKIPATVLSRCQRFDFRRVPLAELADHLATMVEREGLQAEPEALMLIARQATGSVRDAQSLLDQLVSAPGDTITLARAQAVLGTASGQVVEQLADAWLRGDAAAGLALIHTAVDQGADARQFARQVVEYLRGLLLIKMGGDAGLIDAPAEARQTMEAQAERARLPQVVAALKHFNEALQELKGGWQPQLPLELAFIESLSVAEEVAPREARPEVSTPAPQPVLQAPVARPAPPEPEPEPVVAAPPVTASAPPPRAEAQPVPGTTDGAVTLADVKAQWRLILMAAKKRHPGVEAAYASGTPVAVEGNALVVGFEPMWSLIRDKADQPPNRTAFEAALSEVLGKPLGVRCQIITAPPSRIEDDPLIQEALRHGAVIKAVSETDTEI